MYLCKVMHRILVILVTLLYSFAFGYGSQLQAYSADIQIVDELSNRYLQQLECSHRSNDSAERTHSISIPAYQSIVSAAKGNTLRGHSTVLCHISTQSNSLYCVNYNNLYHLFGSRAVDYYLYALCCMRC